MNSAKVYNLIHITTGGEYKTPLVASQLFDQANYQALDKTGFAPAKVEAWIIGPMREYFDNNAVNKIKELKARCPDITIRQINGIGRLGQFPVLQLLKSYRRQLNTDIPVVYHCRGEEAAAWAAKMREAFAIDKVVLDVRGYWPAELIYKNGIDDPALATGNNLALHDNAKKRLSAAVKAANMVTTVSPALKEVLIKEVNAPRDTFVVSCCVNHVTEDTSRERIRKEWGIKSDDIAFVYSGTTAAYQHLEDLTIPFMKCIAGMNGKIKLVFLSSEPEKIKKILLTASVPADSTIVRSYPQNEVANALTACDAGILIRKPTLVNRVANPVKIAEYFAAGLPIVIEKGVGGMPEGLFETGLLKAVEIAAPGNRIELAAGDVNKWLEHNIKDKRALARAYAADNCLWIAAIHISRRMYEQALKEVTTEKKRD